MIIHGMKGLGDNIYQRAFIKALPKPIWLQTPWAELYEDIEGVFCCKPHTTLRTQAKNISKYTKWYKEPVGHARLIQYSKEGIINGLQRTFGVIPDTFDLPFFGGVSCGRRYAVIRPATVRTEWLAETRNPDPQYIAEAAQILHEAGYYVVSVSDLEDGKEWALNPMPFADVQYHKGELDIKQLLALIQNASVVVGGVGWIVPASIAANVPAWIINGGNGGYNRKDAITDSRMDLSKIHFAEPDNFCKCFKPQHNCNKHISHHADKFTEWLGRLPSLAS